MKYLIGLGNEGFEWCYPIPDSFAEDLAIRDTIEPDHPVKHPFSLTPLHLRMRMNSHRNIRNFLVIIDDDAMSEEEVVNQLIENEAFRNLVRERGDEIRI